MGRKVALGGRRLTIGRDAQVDPRTSPPRRSMQTAAEYEVFLRFAEGSRKGRDWPWLISHRLSTVAGEMAGPRNSMVLQGGRSWWTRGTQRGTGGARLFRGWGSVRRDRQPWARAGRGYRVGDGRRSTRLGKREGTWSNGESQAGGSFGPSGFAMPRGIRVPLRAAKRKDENILNAEGKDVAGAKSSASPRPYESRRKCCGPAACSEDGKLPKIPGGATEGADKENLEFGLWLKRAQQPG